MELGDWSARNRKINTNKTSMRTRVCVFRAMIDIVIASFPVTASSAHPILSDPLVKRNPNSQDTVLFARVVQHRVNRFLYSRPCYYPGNKRLSCVAAAAVDADDGIWWMEKNDSAASITSTPND